MKRNILLILIALLPMVASAYDVEIDEIDGICYNFSENKAEVTSGGAKYSGDVVIPSSVTYNGTTYTVTSIGEEAFVDCEALTSVTIPEGVTNIAKDAFQNCFSLTDVYCFAKDIPETMSDPIVGTFKDTPIEKATLHVPAASVGKYKATSPWSRFGKIVA